MTINSTNEWTQILHTSVFERLYDRDRLLGRSTSIGDPITATRMIHRQKEAEDATTMMIQVGNTGNES